MLYDIIIIGGGPAGLTAAVYARRANKTALVIEKGTFGGQITYSPKVEISPASLPSRVMNLRKKWLNRQWNRVLILSVPRLQRLSMAK